MKTRPERRALVLIAAEIMASSLVRTGGTINHADACTMISVTADALALTDHEMCASSRLATRRAVRTIRAHEALRAMPVASMARH